MDVVDMTEELGRCAGYRLLCCWRRGLTGRLVCLGHRASSAPDPDTIRDGEQAYFDTEAELRRAIAALARAP